MGNKFKPRKYRSKDDVPGDYCPMQNRFYPIIIAGVRQQVRLDYNNLLEFRPSHWRRVTPQTRVPTE